LLCLAVVQVSHSVCQDVLKFCIKQQDYWAAAEAWMYCQVYCADPMRQQLQEEPTGSKAVPSLVQIEEQMQQLEQHQQQLREQQQAKALGAGPLGWASNKLLRIHATGLAGWLQQGCVTPKHEQHVRQQLQQVVQELESRGTAVPQEAKAALEPRAAEESAAAAAAESEQGAGSAQ
jgi:hypothetical protein